MKNITLNDTHLNKIHISETKNIKTTNINILLNRVKLNKRQDTKKKLFIATSLLCVSGLTSWIVFFF
jgi:hypothetical protein